MNKVIIGSHAIKQYYPDFRLPKDLDYINKDDQSKTREVENYWMDEFQCLLDANTGGEYLDPDCMLTLKAAHANWNVFWEKTMADIIFLKRKGHTINVPVYKELVKGFRKWHGKESAPLLGKTTKTFFEDAITRIYDHDSVHAAVAYYDEPLFMKTLTDPESGSVMCSEELFNKLSHEDKIKMSKEEIIVTALERYIFPALEKKEHYYIGRSYMDSLKKFVTTMSSGWMSLFLIDNYEELIFDKENYVTKAHMNKNKLIRLTDRPINV